MRQAIDNALDGELRDFFSSIEDTDNGFVVEVRGHKYVFCLKGKLVETRRAIVQSISALCNDSELGLRDGDAALIWAKAAAPLNRIAAEECA